MTLEELLNSKFPGELQGMKIRNFLSGTTKPEYKFLHSLIVAHNGQDIDRNFEAKEAIRALNAIGIHTPSDLNSFVASPLSFIDGISKLLKGDADSFAWERTLKVVTELNLITSAVDASPLRKRADYVGNPNGLRDGYYKVLPVGVQAIKDLLSQSKVKGTQYYPQRGDCDDKAIMFLAELSRQGRGDLAIGYVEITSWDKNDKLLFRHALNFSLHQPAGPSQNFDMYLFDPMTHEIYRTPEQVPEYVLDQEYITIDKIFI